ncbi:MAG: 50S ribosomal protein L4 [Bacteroidales bacterium OttesenSCG-928-I14]|jgi:large subunit ribosomal protein L4|nr:50S ribosomal protein L4 [Bacteroidales bacterium OttesenSCG-928-I14]
MEANVFNIKGEDTGRQIVLEKKVFGVRLREHVVYMDVKRYLSNIRQGTAMIKERSRVCGSTRKLGRQKGSGCARHGDINSPIFIGGASVFGPRPRSYGFKLNKKEKKLARKIVLSHKFSTGSITIIEDFSLQHPKTKEFLTIAKNLKIQTENEKVLIILSKKNNNIFLSVRNIPKIKVTTVSDLNTYNLLDAARLIFFESSINIINKF